MLYRKTMRDMGRNFSQFISIFLMAFLAVFIYSGICGEWIGIKRATDDFYEKTNLADAWIYSSSGFDDEALGNVKALSEVESAQRRTMIEFSAVMESNPKLEVYIVEENTISTPYLVEGSEFDINSDGVWLDYRFAQARNLKVGNDITVTFNGLQLTKNIEGLVYSPEYVYTEGNSMTPDFKNKGFAFVSAKFITLPDFIYSQLLIKANTGNYLSLENQIANALGGKYSVLITRDKHPSYNQFEMEINQHKAMGVIFPPVFALVAILTMITTMARLVATQRTQIGTLKAVGFSKKKIILHYLSYGFFVSLAGSILGVILGPLILPPLFYPSMSAFYTLPVWKPAYDVSFYLMAAVTVVCCTLATYLSSRKVLSLVPAESLRPKEPKILKQKSGATSKVWRKLGFNLQWNLRDIGRNKVRSIMAIVGALGCTALLISAFSMYYDMNDTKVWQYEQINKFETKITLSETITQEQADNIATLSCGEFIMEGAVEVKSNKAKYTGALLVTDGGNLIAFTDKNRNEIILPQNGVSISYKLANQLGVGIGDKIQWHIFSEEGWKECVIAGIYRAPTAQGLTMSKETYRSFDYEFMPSAVITSEHFESAEEGISNILYSLDIVAGWDDMTESMMLMVYILVFAAILLATVVLYNLGVLSFTEMQREFATLKVLGFKTRKLRGLMLVQNLILTFVGFLIGIPFGILLVKAMVASMGNSFDMIAALHLNDVIFSVLIVFGVAIIVNLLFSGKLKKIDMVSALKSSE